MPKIPLPPAESMVLDSLAEVARGGMGSVELARVVDGRLAGQILAVKRLHPNIAEEPGVRLHVPRRGVDDRRPQDPNVAQVVAWGNDAKGMFLAIELVQGVSLSRLYKESQQNKEPFAERTVAFICSQLCTGLVAAHTATAPDGSPLGLVHRDLTPANVLISFDGTVKVIDFGIAKAEERISHTRAGQLKGKPAYMAPEQQRGGAVDARADLFSFGVVMFELLAGRRPWTAKGAFDVMMEISNDPHPSLGDLRKGLNPQLIEIAHRCLEKKPEDRFQSAGEIKVLLDGWLAAKGFSSDDQHSLAQFVLRNSQPQILWWEQALRGEHSKKKAPTFKELEEKIDEDRAAEAKAEARARKTATQPGGPSSAAFGKGTQPMAAYRGPGMLAEGSGPPSSGPVSSRVPPSSGREAAMGPPASLTRSPPSTPAPQATSLAGTEFMAMSPFSPNDPRLQGPQTPRPAPYQPASSTVLMPAGPMASPSTVLLAPPTPLMPTASTVMLTPTLDKTVVDAPGLPPSPSVNPTQPMASVPPPSVAPPSQARRRFPVALAVLFLLLGGASAVGLWFFGDRIGIDLRPHAHGGR